MNLSAFLHFVNIWYSSSKIGDTVLLRSLLDARLFLKHAVVIAVAAAMIVLVLHAKVLSYYDIHFLCIHYPYPYSPFVLHMFLYPHW